MLESFLRMNSDQLLVFTILVIIIVVNARIAIVEIASHIGKNKVKSNEKEEV